MIWIIGFFSDEITWRGRCWRSIFDSLAAGKDRRAFAQSGVDCETHFGQSGGTWMLPGTQDRPPPLRIGIATAHVIHRDPLLRVHRRITCNRGFCRAKEPFSRSGVRLIAGTSCTTRRLVNAARSRLDWSSPISLFSWRGCTRPVRGRLYPMGAQVSSHTPPSFIESSRATGVWSNARDLYLDGLRVRRVSTSGG